MINVSNAYRRAIAGNREFSVNDVITFADGTVLKLGMGDFTAYSINEATSAPGKFEIGAAVIKEYTATLNNADGRFDRYNFEGADILAKVGLKLGDGSWEILQKGTYRVTGAKANELTIDIKAYDSMLFFDVPYSRSALRYPATVLEIVRDCCSICRMTLDEGTVEMGTYTVSSRPGDEAVTCRDIISYCAQIMGCYARISHMDRLVFGWYDFDAVGRDFDGGVFDDAAPYGSGDAIDGGDFADYGSGADADGGEFPDMGGFHHFFDLGSQTIHTDDIEVTGVLVAESDNDAGGYLYGAEGYVLEIAGNPLIRTETMDTVAAHVGGKIVGKMFRPLSVTFRSDPCIEAGDTAIVTDRKQRSYRTVVTNTTFTLGGMQKAECGAETPTEKSFTKYGAATKLAAQADRDVDRKLSAYDIAIQQMNQLAANTMGFYSTLVSQEDGSAIAYRHDKPLLEESKVVYKSGIDGFFVTTDYQGSDAATQAAGKWESGFTKDGNIIAKVLSVIGINFSWAQGGELRLGGSANGNGIMKVLDGNGNTIVQCDAGGITATKGTFSGALSGATGTFSGGVEAASGKIGDFTISNGYLKQKTSFGYVYVWGRGIGFSEEDSGPPTGESDGDEIVLENAITMSNVGPKFMETPKLTTNALFLVNTPEGSGVTAIGVNANGRVRKISSSSQRYKQDIQPLDESAIEGLYALPVRTFRYREGYLSADDERSGKAMPGFIAEELDEILPIAVNHNPDGSAEMWNANIVIPCMMRMIQEQKERIDRLEERLGGMNGYTG